MSAATLKSTKRKKRLDWCCNICDEPRRLFGTLKEVIAHYRKEHPDNGYGLWEIGGDLGDRFSNTAMEEMKRIHREQSEALQRSLGKAKAHDALLERWNALCRALQIGQSALEAYSDAYERGKKA